MSEPTPIVDAAVAKCFSKPVTVEEANFIDVCARPLELELAAVKEHCLANDDDSIIAACNCLTKTPDIQHHKKGCKYRLIVERDTERAARAAAEAKLAELAAQLQIAREDSKRLDWLETFPARIRGGVLIELIKEERRGWQIGCTSEEHITLRAAIDAALAQITDGKEKQ